MRAGRIDGRSSRREIRAVVRHRSARCGALSAAVERTRRRLVDSYIPSSSVQLSCDETRFTDDDVNAIDCGLLRRTDGRTRWGWAETLNDLDLIRPTGRPYIHTAVCASIRFDFSLDVETAQHLTLISSNQFSE